MADNEKLIFVRTSYANFEDKMKPGTKVTGHWIEFLCKEEDEDTGKVKIKIDRQFIDKSDLARIEELKLLKPGMYFDLIFQIVGRKSVVLTEIIPGDMAVDLLSIL